VQFAELKLIKEVPALDFSILEMRGDTRPTGYFKTRAQERVGDDIQVLGFPHCAKLQLSPGKIKQSDAIRIYTSSEVAHGSSGSPMFDKSGSLIGMIDEASSLVEGLGSMLLGGTFEGRAIPAGLIFEMANLEENMGLRRQINLLLDYHRNSIRDATGTTRLRESFEFAERASALAEEISTSKVDISPFRSILWWDRDFTLLPRLLTAGVTGELAEAMEKLSLVYNLEANGMRGQSFEEVDASTLERQLSATGRSAEHIAELTDIIEHAKGSRYPGTVWILVMAGGIAFVTVLVAAAIWSWTLGYVWATAEGGVIRRFFVMIFVGLFFWPLSFIIYWLRS
jgi:hypothetical protein